MIQSLNRSEKVIYGQYKDIDKTKEKLEKDILQIIENLKIFTKIFGIYRIEGMFYAFQNKLAETKKAFDIAIALQPDYPNIITIILLA